MEAFAVPLEPKNASEHKKGERKHHREQEHDRPEEDDPPPPHPFTPGSRHFALWHFAQTRIGTRRGIQTCPQR